MDHFLSTQFGARSHSRLTAKLVLAQGTLVPSSTKAAHALSFENDSSKGKILKSTPFY
jgi:hypothetical protein